jgi:hypothetical protein
VLKRKRKRKLGEKKKKESEDRRAVHPVKEPPHKLQTIPAEIRSILVLLEEILGFESLGFQG